MKTTKFLTLFSSMLLLFLVGCNNAAQKAEPAVSADQPRTGQAFIDDDANTVLHVAIGSADHTTLVAAVQAAKVENALVNVGPLMVFAPTNAAFDKLPAGTVETLLKEENLGQLADILKYHVTPGNYSKDFLKNFKKLGQANNQDVSVEVKGDDVYVGGAKIIASVKASNGIVHVIDGVMLPPAKQ